ncbi:MAG: hypothetical protein P9X24_05790 [Candidatus Hatepunaea meridiana]|nr:hypothetical protein [Candidatus Hatepunaea meridiana]
MDIESFKEEIHYHFHPELDEDGHILREFSNLRLRETLELNFNYMESFDWEGSSVHKHSRLCPNNEEKIPTLTKSHGIPDCLFRMALQLFAESIIEYHQAKNKNGDFKYYPPIVLTFWSGFETFIRYNSELLINTAFDLPEAVILHLRDEEIHLNRKGDIVKGSKYQGVLERYSVFLRYAYNYEVDRGSRFWQNLEKAKQLRDYYTHLDVTEPRVLTSNQILSYLEAILLSIIIPSSHIQRTLLLGVYRLYDIWTILNEHLEEYTEQPFLFDCQLNGGYLFHCNFKSIDQKRFSKMRNKLKEADQCPNTLK